MRNFLLGVALLGATLSCQPSSVLAETVEAVLEKIDQKRGIVCLVDAKPELVLTLAAQSELTLFVLGESREAADSIRERADSEGLLGTRIFVAEGETGDLQLAPNVADSVVVLGQREVPTEEMLRVLRPRAAGHQKQVRVVKPVPEGYDDWSHPFHRADNNPQSEDQYVRGRFRTQFVGYPKFSPMPEQTVIAGGRIYKAMGHIAHKANQNEYLNTLLCINAFNGTILWERPLPEGFMIHRNTMVATEDALYLGDHESCKIIDGETGEIRDEIRVSEDLADGPTWKWMGLEDGILYALIGNREVLVETQKSVRRGLGHWPWGMWKGHEYADPNTSFGFGRTLVAIDLDSKSVRWSHREREFLDARALVMNDRELIAYAPEKFLVSVDRKEGNVRWRNQDADLLAAVGPNGRAQHYITGYATSSYLKTRGDYLFFAGPQRDRLVAASTKDGSLLWTREETGNLQLVLREDGVYAAGPQRESSAKLDYETGKTLSEFPARRACTRATGCADSIFYRASGGTVRVLTETNTAQHIAPMRPPCQDGVLISNGHLYWGPWMCGCQLSLYGNIGLAPQTLPGEPDTRPHAPGMYEGARVQWSDALDAVKPLEEQAGDWLRYRGDDARRNRSPVSVPNKVSQQWIAKIGTPDVLVTAPVAAGRMVFVADRSGRVMALDGEDGSLVWRQFTGGAIYYPPAIADGRLFVGSADGRVHAFEAGTGRALWSFRAGPRIRLIPVFERLVSSWPVAGGVVVSKDRVYAAAGIAHYDGTFVVALDAVSGELKAHNTTSGMLSSQVDSGISMQGNLRIVGNELRFLGGGVYEEARFDLETLACLNEPKEQVSAQFRTAFYPYYPEYNQYVSLFHTLEDGRILSHDANYEGLYFNDLSLQDPPPEGAELVRKDAAGEFIRMQQRRRQASGPKARVHWKDTESRRFNGLIVSGDRLLAAGHPELHEDKAFLTTLAIETGEVVWSESLPAMAVKGGLALDSGARILVSLENGEVHCYR